MTKLASFVRSLPIKVECEQRGPEIHEQQDVIVQRLAGMTTEEGVEHLASITGLNRENDPTNEAAGRPWEWLLQRLLQRDPQEASRAARRWYSVLVTAEMHGDSAVEHRAFSAYLSGIIEALLGNDFRAERWLETGRAEADIEEAGMEAFERAYAFVRHYHPLPGSR